MGRRPKSAEVRARFWSVRASGQRCWRRPGPRGSPGPPGTIGYVTPAGAIPRHVAHGRRCGCRWLSGTRSPVAWRRADADRDRPWLGAVPLMVSRELARNRGPGDYRAIHADRLAEARTRRPKRAKLAVDAVLRAHVEQRLAQRWSPQQISAGLRCDFPDDPRMRVSHEMIYTSLLCRPARAARGADPAPADRASPLASPAAGAVPTPAYSRQGAGLPATLRGR